MPTPTRTRKNFKTLSEKARQDPKRSARIETMEVAVGGAGLP